MLDYMRKHALVILIIIIVAFVAGLFLTTGIGSLDMLKNSNKKNYKENEPHIFGKVNGENLSIFYYYNLLNQEIANMFPTGEKPDPYTVAYLSYKALIKTIEHQEMYIKAKQGKISASASEVKQYLTMMFEKMQTTEQKFKNAIEKQGIPYSVFKDQIKQEIVVSKFLRKYADSVTVTEKDVQDSLTSLLASHILIEGSDQDALKKANDILARVKKGEDFASLAAQYSADKGSAKEGGMLPWFSQGQMVSEFEKAVYSLKPGELYNGVVKTNFGYHIIKLHKLKRNTIPVNADINKYKEKILQMKQEQIISEAIAPLKKDANIEILLPELKAYKLQYEGKLEDAIIEYQKLTGQRPNDYRFYLFIADIYSHQKNYEAALEYYNKAENIQKENPETQDGIVNLAKGLSLFRESSDPKNQNKKYKLLELAGVEFRKASLYAKDNLFIHRELVTAFKKINWTNDAYKEEKVVDRLKKKQEEELKKRQLENKEN